MLIFPSFNYNAKITFHFVPQGSKYFWGNICIILQNISMFCVGVAITILSQKLKEHDSIIK